MPAGSLPSTDLVMGTNLALSSLKSPSDRERETGSFTPAVR